MEEQMPEAAPPRVFISYSHDSPAHQDRVLDLADRLRHDGVDASIDQYEQSPPEGWPAWCEREIRNADFVLLVCTETYFRRVNGEEEPGRGLGVLWEANLIRQHLYDAGGVSNKFIPVLLGESRVEHIPTPVKGRSFYWPDTVDGFESLYRLLTNQPRAGKPEPGKIQRLPERQRQWLKPPPNSGDQAARGKRQSPGRLKLSTEPERSALKVNIDGEILGTADEVRLDIDEYLLFNRERRTLW
jgi:hypothetical protein